MILVLFALVLAAFAHVDEEMTICYRKSKNDVGQIEVIHGSIGEKEMHQYPYSCEGECPCLCSSLSPIEVDLKTTTRGSRGYVHVTHSEDVFVEAIVEWGDDNSDRYVLEEGSHAMMHNYREEKEYDVAISFDGRCREPIHKKIKISF